MSITCEKTFSLHIDEGCLDPVRWYVWPMSEVGADDRVDIINSAHLAVTGAVTDAVGMRGNAASIQDGGRLGTSISPDGTYAINPMTSWSLCFWLKIVSYGNFTSASRIKIDFTWSGSNYSALFFWNGTPSCQFQIENGITNASVYPSVPSLGSWHFIHVFYDADTSQCGVQIDNGVAAFPALSFAPPASSGSDIYALQSGSGSANYYVEDLIFRMDDKFSANQLTYLYNTGLGRDWPYCIPNPT